MKTTSHQDQSEPVVSEHLQCASIFEKLFETSDGNSVGCDIWRALVGDEERYDNCLGENFNQMLRMIREDWFGHPEFQNTSREFYNTTYIYWLYRVVARVYEVFDTYDPEGTNKPALKRRRALSGFAEINLWAKFSKHPKEFLFTHWPETSCEGQLHSRPRATALTINTAYLKEHYASEKSKRPSDLKNNTNVVVEYPKLARLTTDFVRDFLAFRDFICKNEMVIEELQRDTNVPIKQPNT